MRAWIWTKKTNTRRMEQRWRTVVAEASKAICLARAQRSEAHGRRVKSKSYKRKRMTDIDLNLLRERLKMRQTYGWALLKRVSRNQLQMEMSPPYKKKSNCCLRILIQMSGKALFYMHILLWITTMSSCSTSFWIKQTNSKTSSSSKQFSQTKEASECWQKASKAWTASDWTSLRLKQPWTKTTLTSLFISYNQVRSILPGTWSERCWNRDKSI